MKTQREVLLCIVGVACVLAGCSHARRHDSVVDPHLKVLTYNVNYGMPGTELALKAIRAADADLVCLQETTPAWERFLRPRLEPEYPHIRFRHSAGAGGLAFFSKTRFKELSYMPSKAGWFPAWVVEVDTPIGLVQVLSVHLRPPVSDRGSVGVGPYISTRKVRLDETKEFYNHLDPGRPILIVGDFNEGDYGPAVNWLEERGLRDALRQHHRYGNTWEWKTSAITLRWKLDHILHSPDLRCLDAYVIEEGASDHLPVVAVFVPARAMGVR